VTEPNPTPPRPQLRYVVWLVVAVIAVAGVVFYFRYQTSLAPMLGGGK
jgi:type VI protein secretion system component VasF